MQTTDPARATGAGMSDRRFAAANDRLDPTKSARAPQRKNPVAVATATAELTLEVSVEAARVASVTARHFGEQMELGDQFAAEHSLRVVARRLREAIVQFSEWRTLEVEARRDDRGHFVEPHTGRPIGLGTLAVRQYVGSYANPLFEEAGFARATIETHGPKGRYGGLIYIEKEGFWPILERARLAEKFDVSIMSCKGMSVTAARTLIDKTCARYHIPLLILHDFDVSGFSIAKTLVTDTRRFSLKSKFRTVDLGLRLTDVQELGLESEPVSFGNVSPSKIRERIKTNGATADEIAFLMEGQRVELNAMHSDEFVAFVERKLNEAGIAKVIPPKDQLDKAYRFFARSKLVEEAVEKAIAALADAEVTIPDDLEARAHAYLAEHPDKPWEDAVRHAADGAP